MEIREANDLLKPGYLDLESGYTRLSDGQLHVAAWTTMPRCKGAMVEWWFGYLETTEQYKWWHPEDHVWCEWVGERGTGRFDRWHPPRPRVHRRGASEAEDPLPRPG